MNQALCRVLGCAAEGGRKELLVWSGGETCTQHCVNTWIRCTGTQVKQQLVLGGRRISHRDGSLSTGSDSVVAAVKVCSPKQSLTGFLITSVYTLTMCRLIFRARINNSLLMPSLCCQEQLPCVWFRWRRCSEWKPIGTCFPPVCLVWLLSFLL